MVKPLSIAVKALHAIVNPLFDVTILLYAIVESLYDVVSSLHDVIISLYGVVTSLYAVVTLYDDDANWFSLKSFNGEEVQFYFEKDAAFVVTMRISWSTGRLF